MLRALLSIYFSNSEIKKINKENSKNQNYNCLFSFYLFILNQIYWQNKNRCLPSEFQCNDASCVSGSFQCDGEPDCSDASDELNCDTPMPNCPEGEFKCRGSLGGMGGPGGRCVLMRFRCDGDNDCGDWSDEENCPKKQSSCTSTEFRCNDGSYDSFLCRQ